MKPVMFFTLLGMFVSTIAFAQPADHWKNIYHDDPLTKLARGFANIVESPAEFGCQTREPFYDYPDQTFLKILKGIGMTAARFAVGVLEVVTFIIPIDSNLKPVCSSPYYRPI